jgi:KDO2-lipid IV(A) lauroyltransferase
MAKAEGSATFISLQQLAFGEPLPNGEGFNIHLTALEDGAIATTTLLNKAIENQIKQNSSQYL